MGEMTYSEWLHIVDCRLWFRGRWTHSDFEFDWEGAYKYGVNTSEAVDSAIEEAAEQLVDEP